MSAKSDAFRTALLHRVFCDEVAVGTDRLVSVILATNFRPEVGYTELTYAEIADLAGLSSRTVMRSMKRLVHSGVWTVKRRGTVKGETLPVNRYSPLFASRSVGNKVSQ